MKKTALLSVLASTLIMAGGDITPVEPMVETPVIAESSVGIPMGLALLGGIMRGEGDNSDWNAIHGLELSFECLLSDSTRSQLQFTHYDHDGLEMFQLSVNPHYIFNRGDSVEFGAGPHIGVARVEIANEDDTVFTYGLGASVRTNLTENFFAGAEARYEWTTDATFAGIDDDVNNAKVFAKIGYSF
jgi:opacity protein-like surface antigen